MKYIKWHTENGQTAFLAKVSDTCYKAGIEDRVTSGYKTLEEAEKGYDFYCRVVDTLHLWSIC